MLRRRILASAMASVMAIGSVAVVANAEETATTQVKSKADLEAYVKSFDQFREDGINDYGSISGEKFIDAVEYAENVLDDAESTVDNYTVAYAMLEATYKALKIHTVEELKALIDANTKNYESGNVYNEELGDPIFHEDQFEKFEEKYEDAEAVLGSSDSRIITDAYEELEAAANMTRYAVVTKSQFRSAMKAYETALQKEYAYESWRIGTMDGGWFDLLSINGEAGYWGYQNQSIAYGELYEHVAAAKGDINAAYEQMDEIKSLKQTSLVDIVKGYYSAVNCVTVMNAWKADDTNRASKANVSKLLKEYHSRLVYDYNTTAANELFDAVKDFVGGDLKVLIGINKDDTAPVNIYQATKWVDLTETKDADAFATYTAENNGMAWYVENFPYSVNPDRDGGSITVYKLKGAELSIKAGKQFFIPLDDNGYWRKDADGNFMALSDKKPEDGKYKCITKNVSVDLAEFIPVDSSMVTSGFDNGDINNVLDGSDDLAYWYSERVGQWGSAQFTKPNEFDDIGVTSADVAAPYRTYLNTALALAELYMGTDKAAIAADSNPIYTLDTPDAIAEGTAKGSSAEWTIVYRYLKYALADKYDADRTLYTKADVEKLIEDSYELAELTGDAALFSVNHNFLVDARQNTLEWVKAANKEKKYKDNFTTVDLNGSDQTSTAAYLYLKGYYDALKRDYEAFKYSFEQVYMAIADTKAAIDDGELEATDALLQALESTAYALSTVEAYSEEDGEFAFDNDGFTSDRYFQEFNRVFTGGDGDYKLAYKTNTTTGGAVEVEYITVQKYDNSAISASHKSVKVAYEALLAEVKKQTEVTAILGDVNGDGVVNALDAAEILKAAVNNTVIDVKVGDYNADGAVNALDASAILKFVVGLA